MTFRREKENEMYLFLDLFATSINLIKKKTSQIRKCDYIMKLIL